MKKHGNLVTVVVLVLLTMIPSYAWKSCVLQLSRTTRTQWHKPKLHSNTEWNSIFYSMNNGFVVGRCFMSKNNNRDDVNLKSELKRYLQVRSERGEEDVKEEPIIIGGTRGNIILDYVSGSPNKEMILTEKPNIFDYSELEKYGFGVALGISTRTYTLALNIQYARR
jgi:hypothetical protein